MESVTVREIFENDKAYWDENVQHFEHVHPFNAYDWGDVRAVDGWNAVYLVAERSGQFSGGLLLLVKKILFLPWRIFYGPKGPICRPDDGETIQAIHAKVLELAKESNALFLRIDPSFTEEESESFERIMSSLEYVHLEQRWTFWNSPRDVYRIGLNENRSIEDLYNALDRDDKRCIRKAFKDGVIVEPATTEDELRSFYDIFREFSVTKEFMARGYDYQRRLWESYVNRGRGCLFITRYEGNVIGGLICILFGRKCLAMHMGAPYKYHKLQPYYAFVWESIRWAKQMGCVWYSFRGVGTTPTQEAFKRKFNPKVVRLVGYYDFPFRPFLYKLFYWAEFTMLPASWPLIVKTRKFANQLMKALSPSRQGHSE